MLPQKLPIDLMQTKWAAELNPLLTVPITQGVALKGIVLVSGNTVINHKLGRLMQGYFITDQNAVASINRLSTAAFNDLTLTLSSTASVTINLWVF